jgi:hypothetical protein
VATVEAIQGQKRPNSANLSTAQTGNADSTNVVDTGAGTGPCLLKITTTVGATPTVTVNIVGSADGTNFFNIPYAVSSTPTTVAVAALTITTAVTTYYYLQAAAPWRFLKLVYSANTNVTSTADVWTF